MLRSLSVFFFSRRQLRPRGQDGRQVVRVRADGAERHVGAVEPPRRASARAGTVAVPTGEQRAGRAGGERGETAPGRGRRRRRGRAAQATATATATARRQQAGAGQDRAGQPRQVDDHRQQAQNGSRRQDGGGRVRGQIVRRHCFFKTGETRRRRERGDVRRDKQKII